MCSSDLKGETTSGVFSPSLKQSIAIARVPKDFDGETAKVLMRGKEVDVRVLKLPFMRNRQKQFDSSFCCYITDSRQGSIIPLHFV